MLYRLVLTGNGNLLPVHNYPGLPLTGNGRKSIMVALAYWRITLIFPPNGETFQPFKEYLWGSAVIGLHWLQPRWTRVSHRICNTILYGFPRSNRTWRRTWISIHIHAEVWATAKYGSVNSATNWLVIHYYPDLTGYKFMNFGNWIISWEFPTLWLAMHDCMELPIGKIREIDKLSVYQYPTLYTSTVGFDLSVSLLCDGRLQWSSSHLTTFV
jgi:hypothetical protein